MKHKTIATYMCIPLVGWALLRQQPLKGAEVKPLVSKGSDGKLVYTKDEQGNRIGDFSRCGYMGGGVRIPLLPAVATLSPLQGEADDTERIQSALDTLAARKPDDQGLRGALLLKRGTYRVYGTLKLSASGVVLRGEGRGEDGTILLGTGKVQRTLIAVGAKVRIKEVAGSRQKIADNYVPWGVRDFELESAKGFSVGDSVMVFRPSTANWISDIGMDRIKARSGTKQWASGSCDLKFERTITAIIVNRIQLDAPVVNAMESKYGGGFVFKFTEEGRSRQVGVENLRLISEYEKGQENKDEAHAWTGVGLNHTADSWVRNVTTVHFSHAVSLGSMSKFVTVQDCACLKPVSLITGGRRYPFCFDGQYGLVQRCYSDNSRHAAATGSAVCGPNVFLDCLAENTHSDIGPHHRWAVGILWDNLKGGDFNAQDRGNMGSGHGWAGAQQLFWNCVTSSICVQQPPTAQNYAIGCIGKVSKGSFPDRKPGHYESHGAHVEPRSLYVSSVKSEVPYGSQNVQYDDSSNHQMQNIIRNGGVCGRRAFFGRFILRSFGIPTWGVTQKAHAALSHWTPKGWVVNLGAGFTHSWWDKDDVKLAGSEFLLESQARAHPKDYFKILRSQMVSRILAEPAYSERNNVEGGFWSRVALHQSRTLAANTPDLGALGQELAEANEQEQKLESATAAKADREIQEKDGGITIPAVAHEDATGKSATMRSFSGGMQIHAFGGFKTDDKIHAPMSGNYLLTAKVATAQTGQKFLFTVNGGQPVEQPAPYTIGLWQTTEAIPVALKNGSNSLHFEIAEGSRGVTIKEFTLTHAK